ncbi:MAG: hypothetical protein LBB15_01040 [Puniceicoccales bacterium]|jgi:hypothetical protein|nr:hypothetical protein [Puniceicoccales bacterium]
MTSKTKSPMTPKNRGILEILNDAVNFNSANNKPQAIDSERDTISPASTDGDAIVNNGGI